MNRSSASRQAIEQGERRQWAFDAIATRDRERSEDFRRVLSSPQRLDRLRDLAILDTPEEESFERLGRLAQRLVGAPIALVSLVTDEHQFFKSCVGLGDPWASQRGTALSHSLCQHVVVSQEPLILDDTRGDPQWRDHPAVTDIGVGAYLGIPLVTPDDLVLGSFCAIDTAPHHWAGDDVDAMRDLAAVVMREFALRASALQLEVERDRARSIMEVVGQGLVITDETGSVVEVNPAFADMVGRERAALSGVALTTLLPANRPAARRDGRIIPLPSRAGIIPTIDLQLQHSDGELVDTQIVSAPLPMVEGRREIVSSVSDLTEAKAIERELRRERDFTAAILETAGSLVVVIDQHGRLLRFNRACELLTGRSFAQVAGQTLDRALSADEAAPFIATWDLLRAGLPPVSFEHEWRATSGETACIDWTISAILGEDGKPAYVIGVGIDITTRKRAEQQRAAEHEVAALLAVAESPAAVAGEFLEAVCSHLDMAVGELWLPADCGTKLMRTARWSIADERDQVLAERTAAITFAPGEGLPGRVWATGEPIWWLPTGAMRPDLREPMEAAGIAGGLVCPLVSGQTTLGVLLILSEVDRLPDDLLRATLLAIGRQFGHFLQQRRAEAALQQAHQRLDLHIQNAPLGVIEWGPDLRIQRWSDEAERLFGWSAAEVLGRRVDDWPFICPDDRALVRSMAAELLSGRADRNTHRSRNFTKDGGIVHVEWHNSVLRDPDGQLLSVMSLGLDVTERVLLQDRLAHQATHDTLTGLPNRALLLERLGQEVARAGRIDGSVAVLFLDLDGFKAVNDRLGHAMGDALLIAVAARLQGQVRGGDTVARLGGDEFVILLGAPIDQREAVAVAQRLHTAITRPIPLEAGAATVGTSIGIALSTPDRAVPEVLLADADAAMYRAKQSGKGRYALASSLSAASV